MEPKDAIELVSLATISSHAVETVEVTINSGLLFMGFCLCWALFIGGIVESIKKAVDEPIDPKTKEGIDIIRETTIRGHKPITSDILDKLKTGELTLEEISEAEAEQEAEQHKIQQSVSGKFFRRPAWFRHILPILPLMIGFVTGIFLFPVILSFSGIRFPATAAYTLPSIGCFFGLGTGSFSGQFYKAWESLGGARGMLSFAAKAAQTIANKFISKG